MKILNLVKEAIRPRILLIDFDKTDAQSLRDCGYKVYLGSSGIKDGVFNIPIELHRVDIVVYRASYENKYPKPGKTIKLYSITDYAAYSYKGKKTWKKEGKIWYTHPEIAASSRCNYSAIASLREKVLLKGGSLIVFKGHTRINSDEKLIKDLLDVTHNTIYRSGGEEKEYELHFKCDAVLEDIGKYFERLITGATGHQVNFIEGIPEADFQRTDHPVRNDKFCALDENKLVYAYFKRRGGENGNLIFLPDYGHGNINIVKYILSKLPALSPDELFNRSYQKEVWLESKIYKFSDESDIIQQQETAKRDLEEELERLENKRIEARANTNYFRAILTNGDDDNVDEEEKLKPPLRKLLEWLGIKVIDLDKILKKKDVALMNDFILKADGKEILCEAKGVKTGPRGEYIEQVRSHIIRFSNLTARVALPGLLILNYQRDTAPHERSEFYPDIARQRMAEESLVGLLDTRELFDICKKIYGDPKKEELLKKQARKLIFTPGIIHS